MLISFFTPAKCAFYDGTESWDTGHLSFVCYVMKRVEVDKQKLAAAQKLFYSLGWDKANGAAARAPQPEV